MIVVGLGVDAMKPRQGRAEEEKKGVKGIACVH